MVTIKSENIKPFDIDETLILTITGSEPEDAVYTAVQDPLDETNFIEFRVHEPMVRLLKEESARGAFVIAHSRSGFQWAQNVIDALELKKYVNICMSKPIVYFDDKDVTHWLKDRVYLDPNTPYKK